MLVSEDTIRVLEQAEKTGSQLRLVGARLDRKSYEAAAKAIEAAGGKWNCKAEAHLFDGSALEAIEPILLTGEITSAKQEFGAFFTPPDIAQRVMEIAELRHGMEVLEPRAGLGALATPARDVPCLVDCVEILGKHVARLVDSNLYRRVISNDFLCEVPRPTYDRVVMNPPFAKQADIAHVSHAARFLRTGGRLVAIMSNSITFRTDARPNYLVDTTSHNG